MASELSLSAATSPPSHGPSWAHPLPAPRNVCLQVLITPDPNPSLLGVAFFHASPPSHTPGPLCSFHKGSHGGRVQLWVVEVTVSLQGCLVTLYHIIPSTWVWVPAGAVVTMAPLLDTGLPRAQSIPCSPLFLSKQPVLLCFTDEETEVQT